METETLATLKSGGSVEMTDQMVDHLESQGYTVYTVYNLDRVGLLSPKWVGWVHIDGKDDHGLGRCLNYSRRDLHCVGRATNQ